MGILFYWEELEVFRIANMSMRRDLALMDQAFRPGTAQQKFKEKWPAPGRKGVEFR